MDWKIPKQIDRTERPSKDFRDFQNCMSEIKEKNVKKNPVPTTLENLIYHF